MTAYIIRRLLWMIPTFLGILLITFAVVRMQGLSLASQMQEDAASASVGGSAVGGGGRGPSGAGSGGSANLENYLDRFRRAGNDKPALLNTRGFLDRASVEAILRAAAPTAPEQASAKSEAEKALWLCGRPAVLPLAEILADDGTAELHGPASLAFSLCAYTTITMAMTGTVEGTGIQEDNTLLRSNRIAFRRDASATAGTGFISTDPRAAEKRARLLSFVADPKIRARYELRTRERWTMLLGDTGFTDIMGKLFTGTLESQSRKNQYAFTLISERWGTTALLIILSTILAWMVSIPLGIRSARRHGTLEDAATTNSLFALWSLPPMFVGMLMLYHLCTASATGPAWFPSAGLSSPDSQGWEWWKRLLDTIWHGVLPLICLTYAEFTVLSRYMRGGLLDQLSADYVRTARAKGMSENAVVYRHAVPNSLITMITLGSGLLSSMFAGSVVVERIFSIQGLGLLLLEAAKESDAPLIMAATVVQVGLLLIGILIADLLYGWADPRIRNRYG